MEQMHTIKDVQQRLQIGESTVRALIDRGKLHVVRIGRLVRIPESAIAKLLNAGTPVAHLNNSGYTTGLHRRSLGREERKFSWQR